MKKNKNRKIKVNAYYNGMNTINNIVGATSVVGSALSGISDEGSAVNTAGNVLSSAGSLAAAGSAFGPIGTGVGAALGAVVGGITAARKRKQLIDKRIRDKYIKSTEVGMNQSAADAEEYWNNNNVAYSFENGGILPDLAYVDNNEILRDDNGNITKVPNNIPGTDNHLIDSSSLDSVLSDNIKRPGTKNTFAKEGEKLVKRMKPSKGKDKFAENTNRLNKLNANKAYEALLAEQEQVKAKKGIKPKTKSLIPAYGDGTEETEKTVPYDPYEYEKNTARARFLETLKNTDFTYYLRNFFNSIDTVDELKNKIKTRYTPGKDSHKFDLQNLYSKILEETNKNVNETSEAENNSPINNRIPSSFYRSTIDDGIPEVDYSVQPVANVNNSKVTASVSTPSTKSAAKTNTTTTGSNNNTVTEPNNSNVSKVPKQFNPFLKPLEAKPLSTKPNYPTTAPKVDTGNISKKNTQSKDNKSAYPIDWASLAPTIYNTLQGLKNPEIDPLVTNPYNNQIINSMAKRRMNIDPILSANARSRAISNYNLANLNANTGANLAARTQAAVNEYAANEALYGTKQNTDNAYIADYANTLNNLGQQYTSSKATNIDLNARNRAATRAFTSKAASQLGEWSQINSKMRNEYNRDMMMWPLLEDFLSQGYTTDKLAQLKRYM